MMTLKETIDYFEAKAKIEQFGLQAAHYRAIAEWLRELRRLRHRLAEIEKTGQYNYYKYALEPEDEED